MSAQGFALFDTPIGTCALVWSGRGITGLQLPEPTPAATRARVKRRWPDAVEAAAVPAGVQRALDRVQALLAAPTPISPTSRSISTRRPSSTAASMRSHAPSRPAAP